MNISAAPWSGSLLIPLVNFNADFSLSNRLLLTGILSFALLSCSSIEPAGNFPAENSRLSVSQLDNWSLRGRLNIRSGNNSDTVNINWQQAGSEYEINLSGTLGLGAVRLSGGAAGVRIEKSGEEPFTAASLEAVTSDMLGYMFPAYELLSWVRGIPSPGRQAQISRSQDGLISTLDQVDSSGRTWALEYDRYMNINGYVLPGRIRLEQAPYQLTFVISNWELP